MPWFVGLLLLAQLGGPFTDAVVTGERIGDRIEIDLEVGIDALNIDTVLVHIIEPGGEQATSPLNERGGGRYGAVITLPASDVIVVFEALATGESVLSQPSTLTGLGLDVALLERDRPFATVEIEPDDGPTVTASTRRWGWAALGLVAASLAVLAVWAAGPRRAGAHEAQLSGSEAAEEDLVEPG